MSHVARIARQSQKLTKWFESHPLIQYAFKEAISIMIDLANSNGDFTKVLMQHAGNWAIDIGAQAMQMAVAAAQGALNMLVVGWNMFGGAQLVDAVNAGSLKVYDFIVQHAPQSVKDAILTLDMARKVYASYF